MTINHEAAFSGKRVLITGGAGFIGSNLARRLVGLGARVAVFDSLSPQYGGNLFNLAGLEDQISLTIADLRDAQVVGSLVPGQDFLFNLAGQSSHIGGMQDPETDLAINAAAQPALLKACLERNPAVRVVYAGTRQVYGHPRYLPVDESHPLAPLDFNSVSKLAGESYHMIYHQVYGLPVTCLRMTNVYGPRMRTRDSSQTFIGWWFRQVLENQELQVYGDGRQQRDFIYVDDVVEALLIAAADPAACGQIYNLGSRSSTSLIELARLIIQINGGGSARLVPFPEERRRIEIGDYTTDIAKITAGLGWEPKVSLPDGIARSLAYYRQYRIHYW